MKISYNWLREYIETDLSPEALGVVLTDIGLEVEGVEHREAVKGGLEGIVVGEVLECEQHPNADKLKLTKVDLGGEEPVQIVCGAPNVAAGQKVAVATIGTTLYDGDQSFKIKKGKIRGEFSFGMICAEDELGLGGDHSGIMVLENTASIGTPLKEVIELSDDHIIEIGLTPNRSDAMSHWGVARDLKAGIEWRDGDLKYSSVDWKKPVYSDEAMRTEVLVEDSERAPRYCGLEIRGLEVKPSPDWLKERLLAIGLSPINNVVDATNYILHGIGQPLHAFDLDKIKGNKVLVKTLPAGSKFRSLDGVDRELDAADLMICNESEGMCIAGVYGGMDSGVSDSTTGIFLESAYFNPVSIRKSAKRHALNTDASFRFERGIDPNITLKALEHAAALIVEVAGGSVHGPAVDLGFKSQDDFTFEVNPKRMNRRIGQDIPADDLRKILEDLEMSWKEDSDESWTIQVPPYRTDVQREADLIEDVLRIYGYNQIAEPERMQISLTYSDVPEPHQLQERVSDILSAQSFHEAMSNSLVSAEYNSWSVENEEKRVAMLNPLSGDMAEMRTSLIPEMLASVQRNSNHKRPNVKLFEFGKVYGRNELHYHEREQLIMIANGALRAENWQAQNEKADIYWMRGLCEMILVRLGLLESVRITSAQHNILGDVVEYKIGKKSILRLGVVAKSLKKKAGIKVDPVIAEWEWSNVVEEAKKRKPSFKDISKFPEMRRDFALLLDDHISFVEVKEESEKAVQGGLLRKVSLFDVYTGDKLPAGKKSYAVSYLFQDDNKTMTDKQVDKMMSRIQNRLESSLNAELR